MSVTIEQIAQKVGVSPGTVSRVLNGKNKENRPTMIKRAKRIRQIAAEMGYRPNAAARQMVRGRFDLIAFLNCGDTGLDWFPRRLLHGMHDRVVMRGSRLAMTEVPSARFAEPNFAPDVLLESMVDGVIAHLGINVRDQASAMFDADPLPVVYVNHVSKHNAVYPDEVQGGAMITRALLAAGHRHIGFITPGAPNPKSSHFSEFRRVEGYRRALREAGLPPDRHVVAGPRWDFDDTLPPLLDYLDRHPELTAAVVYKCELAIALREAALRRGRLDRMCIAVFHDSEFHSMTGIPMTTIQIPFRRIGEAAADMVHRLILGDPGPCDAVVVPYEQIMKPELIVPPPA